MSKNEMIKDYNTFILAVEAEYLTYNLEKLQSTRDIILKMYQESILMLPHCKEDSELQELIKSNEKMIQLIYKIVDQFQIKETLLQSLKNNSINLDNNLIAILSFPLKSQCLESKKIIKLLIEEYIFECDRNIEGLKQFVKDGTIEDFGDIPNYSNQMELTKINKNKLIEKLLDLYIWIHDNQSNLILGVFEKLIARTTDLCTRINNCKILSEKNVNKTKSDYQIIVDYLNAKTTAEKIRNDQLKDIWIRGDMVDKYKWNGNRFF